MSKWNQETEEDRARSDCSNLQSNYARADLVVAARKRAFDAEQKTRMLQAELDALKAAHAWIKTSERMPDDDARLLALVVDDTGTEQVEIVNFLACLPAWQFDNDDALIDDELVMAWMPILGRT